MSIDLRPNQTRGYLRPVSGRRTGASAIGSGGLSTGGYTYGPGAGYAGGGGRQGVPNSIMRRSVSKVEPNRDRPLFLYWTAANALTANDPAWTMPNIVVGLGLSYANWWTVPGAPSLSVDVSQYNTGSYSQLNSADYLAVSDAQLGAKIEAHAKSMAENLVNLLRKNGLTRGAGNFQSGQYGGCFYIHDFGAFKTTNGEAWRGFSNYCYHPMDAVDRTQVFATSLGNRSYTAHRRSYDGYMGSYPNTPTGWTQADEAQENDSADGLRPITRYTLYSQHGIRSASRMMECFAAYVRQYCDEANVCYPAHYQDTFEYFSGYTGAGQQYRSPALGFDGDYAVMGSLWHCRGNRDTPNTRWLNEPIYYLNDGTPVTYASAIANDPVLSGSYFAINNFPTSTQAYYFDVEPDSNNSLKYRSAWYDHVYTAMQWMQYSSVMVPLRDLMPHMRGTNFEFVKAKSGARWHLPVPHSPKAFYLSASAPRMYPRSGTAELTAYRADPTEAKLRAYENAEVARLLADYDSMIDPAFPCEPWVYATVTANYVATGDVNEPGLTDYGQMKLWSGLRERGVTTFNVYGGNGSYTLTTATIAAWLETM